MKYRVKMTPLFRKDYKRATKRMQNVALLETIVYQLACGEPLAYKHHDHALIGEWLGYRECHIAPDWLLIYRIEGDILLLTLTRTGTHSDLL